MNEHGAWSIRVLVLVAVAGCLIVLARPSIAAPPRQIVRPEDVATPTPTYEVILVPTPTPAVTPPPAAFGDDDVGAARGTYTVQPGDTLLTVALEVGLDVSEIPCAIAPDFRPEQPLVIGNMLSIPDIGWRCHRVELGDSLASIAVENGSNAQAIAAVPWNELGAGMATDLAPGRYLRIPPMLGESEGGFLGYMLAQPLGVSPLTAYAVGGPRAGPAVGGSPAQELALREWGLYLAGIWLAEPRISR